jgi:hypothetical protein
MLMCRAFTAVNSTAARTLENAKHSPRLTKERGWGNYSTIVPSAVELGADFKCLTKYNVIPNEAAIAAEEEFLLRWS